MLSTQGTEQNSNLVEAFAKMGLLCDRAGKIEDAAFHYQQALSLGKNSPELQHNLGRILQQQGDFTGAIDSYQQALAVNPDDVKAHYNTGVVVQQQGKIEAAIYSYQQAISCWKKSSQQALLRYAVNAYSNWGCILVQEGKVDEAIAVFQAGIAVAPDDAALYNNLAISMLQLGKPEEAIALCRRAIELQPELVMARYNLGKAFQRLGLHTFAVECFELVISKQPHHVSAYSDRAFSLMAQGKLAEAMLCWQNAIAMQSQFVDGFCRQVEMRLTSVPELNELDRAQIACVRFLKQLQGKDGSGSAISSLAKNPLHPSSLLLDLAEIYCHLGNALFEYGGYEQAESYYQKALQIQPKNADIYWRLADCLSQQKRFSAAIVVYHMVLAIAGDRSDVSEQLQGVLKKQQELIHSQENESFVGVVDGACLPPHQPSNGRFNHRGNHGGFAPTKNETALPLPPLAKGGDRNSKSECQGLDCQRCLRRIFRQFEPVHLGNGVYSCTQQGETAVESPETFVTSLPNGRAWIVPQKNSWMICNAIAIIDSGDRLLPELSREYPGELPGCENPHSTQHRFLNLKPEELPSLEQIDGTVAVLAGLSGNVYFHWMVDILPRIEVLQRWGINLEEIDRFLVNSCQQPFQRETLKALGIPEYKIIESDRHPYIQAKQLIVPSFAGYLGWLSPGGLEFLRRVFLNKKLKQLCSANIFLARNTQVSEQEDRKYLYPERIYISRSKSSYRRVINEEQVVQFLSGFGFVSVLLESMTVEEQITLFSRAKAIVAPHGSGLTNIIFCGSGTKVIELVSPNYIRHYYWAIANQLNLPHYYVIGQSFNCYQVRQLMYQNPLTEDILVNLNSLKKMLSETNLFASKSSPNLMSLENPKNPTAIMNQESADYFQKRAEFYLEQGKLSDAVAACEQALKQKPDFAPAYKTLGKVSQVQGNLAKAKHWYVKALENQPDFAEVYTNLATLYTQEKNWERALICYQKANSAGVKYPTTNSSQGVLAFKPDDIEVYIQGAEAFYAQRKFEQAAAACQRVIQVKPDARAYKIWGNARQAQGKVEEAKNCYAKAIELDPDFAEAYTNLGTLYAQEHQWQSAIAFYQKAIALQPNLASTYRNLARVRAQMGQLSEADECWFKAYSLEPAKATPEEHIHLGDNFLKQNQVTQAIRCYCHAIELNPNSNQAYQQLGNALKAQKKVQEEVANYRKIIERPANIFGDFFKTVVVSFNPKSELSPNPQTSTLQANVAANSLQLDSTVSAEKPRVQLQQQATIPAVPQQLNTIALSENSAPATQNSAEVLSPVTVVDSGFTADFRQQETADDCIQRAGSYGAQKQFDRAIAECKRAIEIKPDARAYKMWGKILQLQGKTQEAIECYKKALQINHNQADIYVNLGTLYAISKQLSPAISCYQKAIAIQPNLAPAYRNLARVWRQQGKQEEANECWYEAYSLEPEKVSPDRHFKLGNLLFKQGQITYAIACYRRAIELNPNLTAAYQNLAIALKKQGKLDEAAVCLQKVAAVNGNSSVSGSQAADTFAPATQAKGDRISHKPAAAVEVGDAIASLAPASNRNNGYSKSAESLPLSALDSGKNSSSKPVATVNSVSAETYIKKAEAYYAQGKFEEAIAECKRAIEIKPEAALAYKIAGNATQAMGKVDAARYWYAQALEIDPNFAEIHANLGSLYAQQKQWPKSIACYQEAIKIKPNLASAYRNLARVFLQSGEPQAGAECWYEALTLDLNWAKPDEHFTLGNTLLELGQFDRAISCYRRAIQLQPSYADAYHNLGEVLSVMGQCEEAIAAYRQAIDLNPNFDAPHYGLGKALASLDRREEAIACYRRAIELNPNLVQAYQSLGDVLDSWGQLDEAIGCYEKTIELKPDIWEVHQKLGDALQERGEIDEAIEAYNRAIELAKV
ncbi:tetratricopeptide repeat protein [Tychonema sp. LEGE 07203]|uniref:tetratricopeptide repeat protein n=1 Tax=Tychonema sp. LEGE 07203 TaxID=1828671 RepID=UPI00187F2A83|nr:tetratricopeptide repeat protein [Tychonema sp. LEGE 07203]MBE9094356.1 tetratricopeptide repeat protein [Tychonema sp. LEGE 07203]